MLAAEIGEAFFLPVSENHFAIFITVSQALEDEGAFDGTVRSDVPNILAGVARSLVIPIEAAHFTVLSLVVGASAVHAASRCCCCIVCGRGAWGFLFYVL